MENGPLNPTLRMEAAIGRAVVAFSGKGSNLKVRDFMPWPKEQEAEATPEAILMMLKNAASAGKRKH